MRRHDIKIEGYSVDEILALPDEVVAAYVFIDEPCTINIGTATLLAQFKRTLDRLTAELGHIDGGGKGVLPILASLLERYCRARGIGELEWIVLAANCANPNLRLRSALEQRRFVRKSVPEVGAVYYRLDHL